MLLRNNLLGLAAIVAAVEGAFQGFNYGSTFTNGAVKVQADFEAEFKKAAGLPGTNGAFKSARLFSMVQGGTANDPISAIPAAISTKTSMLFGLWASAGQESFNNEVTALRRTIQQYCGQLDNLVAGISVGSEDLYRISPIGIAQGENPGASPSTLVNYVHQVRDAIKGSCLQGVKIGHVDTWTAYVNGSNKALIDAVDWLGMDAYPYFENTKPNSIEKGRDLFQAALDQTGSVAGGKPIWVTETGWPVSGKTMGQGVPSRDNAKSYWQQVGCSLFGSTNTWWYTLQDGAPTTPNPSFGIIGSDLSAASIYDLSCQGVEKHAFTIRSVGARDNSASGSEGTQDGASENYENVVPPTADGSHASIAAAALAIVLALAMV